MILGDKGQSIVEAALIMPLIVFFLFTVIWFAQVLLTWQQLIGAARYGTDLIAYTNFNSSYIKRDIVDYLCNENNIGRILNRDKLEVNVEIRDADKIDYSLKFDDILQFNPLEIFEHIKALNPLSEDKSYVEIIYRFNLPFVLKAMGKEEIKIRAYCEVLSGAASAGAKEREG
jgi:hypothetical protein